MLHEEFLIPLGMSQVELARRMGVPIQLVNTLVKGKRGVTAKTAILLSRVLGTSEEFWMNAQNATDLWQAHRALKRAGCGLCGVPKVASLAARLRLVTRSQPFRCVSL